MCTTVKLVRNRRVEGLRVKLPKSIHRLVTLFTHSCDKHRSDRATQSGTSEAKDGLWGLSGRVYLYKIASCEKERLAPCNKAIRVSTRFRDWVQ